MAGLQFKNKGNQFFKAKDYPQAIEFYSKAIEAEPKNQVYYSNRSAAYLANNELNKAWSDGVSAINLKPDWKKGYFRAATALQGLKRYGDAYNTVQRGLAKLNNDKDLTAKLAELEPHLTVPERYKYKGNYEFQITHDYTAAIKWYEKAVDKLGSFEKLSDAEKAIWLSCNKNIAGCYQQLSDHKRIAEYASLVLEYYPHDFKSLVRRGLALEALEKYRMALNDIRQALLLNPRDSIANKAQNRIGSVVRQLKKEKRNI